MICGSENREMYEVLFEYMAQDFVGHLMVLDGDTGSSSYANQVPVSTDEHPTSRTWHMFRCVRHLQKNFQKNFPKIGAQDFILKLQSCTTEDSFQYHLQNLSDHLKKKRLLIFRCFIFYFILTERMIFRKP